MYGDSERDIDKFKEEIKNTIKETNRLLKRAELLRDILNKKIEAEQIFKKENMLDKNTVDREIEKCLSSLHSDKDTEKINAVKMLNLLLSKASKEKRKITIRELANELKSCENFELAKEIIYLFYQHRTKTNSYLLWTLKYHSSDKIRHLAKSVLEEIEKEESEINERDNWKMKFFGKLRKYYKRKGMLDKYLIMDEKINRGYRTRILKDEMSEIIAGFMINYVVNPPNNLKEKIYQKLSNEDTLRIKLYIDKIDDKMKAWDVLHLISIKMAMIYLNTNEIEVPELSEILK